MTCGLAQKEPDAEWLRVGRGPDPWAWPDWTYVHPDGTFGCRWDDPESSYRVLYTSSSRLGAYLETMAWARPDPGLDIDIKAITPTADDDDLIPGVIDAAWLNKRRLGRGRGLGSFAMSGNSTTLSQLRGAMAPTLARYGLTDLDAAAIRLTSPRGLTQRLSRLIYRCLNTAASDPAYDGIHYLSKYGDDLECWALFEGRGDLRDTEALVLDPTDPELVEASKLLRVVLDFR